MTRSIVRLMPVSACMLVWTVVAGGQFGRGGAEWMTNGSDAQRSHWIPADARISIETLRKPGFQFLWKVKLNNDPVQLNSLTPAVLMDRYIGYKGFRSLAFLAGSSNIIYAIDTDLSRIEWQHRLPPPASPGTLTCPGGLTTNIAREISAAYPSSAAVGGGLGGRGGPARSDVGEPDKGAVTLAALTAAALPVAPAPAPAPRVRPPAVVYAAPSDGMLHSMYISNGVDAEPPIKFLPPDANAQGLIVLDGVAWAATSGCNGGPGGIWALDLASKQVMNWHPSNGGVAGSANPAFGPDGTAYATTSTGEAVALDPKTLAVKDTYTTGGQGFSSSPVVFPYKGRNLIAAATKDGRIHLLDSASLGGSNHQTAVFRTSAWPAAADFAPGALATWQSVDGVRWILAAVASAPASGSGFSPVNGAVTNGAIAAWRVVERNGTISLDPGWISRDMISPLAPIIVNGVVFAVSSGEYRSEDAKLTAAQRARRSSPAVLYALDGATGKVLWDSGKTMTSFVHSGGVSGGAGQLYLAAYDQTLYAFGFPIEH
jgi:outer membrane protein assembly factor BamB